MKTLLIVGVDTVVGANLAACWSETARVFGLSAGPEIEIAGCQTAICEKASAESTRRWIQQVHPQQVIYCGAASRSAWEGSAKTSEDGAAEAWATAAAQNGIHFTLISSDAIFTGPWMFHGEDSESFCDSAEARAIRATEARVQAACPKSLIIRSNAFGWSARKSGGWIESLIAALESNRAIELDPIGHASPILASDLADYLEAALQDELIGVFHVAGAERINSHQFLNRLATAFDLNTSAPKSIRELSDRPTGFARGEASLNTKRFCGEYDCAMPLLSEGIERLVEQHRSGYRDRLSGSAMPSGKAA